VLLVGRGARRYRDALEAALAGRVVTLPDEALDLPDAGWLALAAGLRPGPADDPLDPLYLRKPEAEEKWEAAQAPGGRAAPP
jgi:hypothetical protein